MKLAIVSFAHVHAERYQAVLNSTPGIECVGIFDEDAERGRAAAQKHGTRFYPDLDQLLAGGNGGDRPDGVIVCSENSRHRDHCVAALDAGVHVLCEKPIATTLYDARAIIDSAAAGGRILKIAFTTRFSEAAEQLVPLVRRGEIGDPITLVGMNRGQNPGGWFVESALSGGGSMMDHIVHQLDFARWIFGLEPERVYAEQAVFFSDIAVEDAGLVLVEMQGGVPLTIDASWSRPASFPTWGDNVLEINGSLRSLRVDTQASRIVRYGEGVKPVEYVPYGRNTSREMILDFCAAIAGKENKGATGEDGCVALEVVLAAYRSAASGVTVPLPLAP